MVRFISIDLHEPLKSDVVLYQQKGDSHSVSREAFVVLLDNGTGKGGSNGGRTIEAIVSLSDNAVKSFKHIEGAQPRFTLDEFFEVETTIKKDASFIDAMKKRGVTNMDLVCVDPWSAGVYDDDLESDQGMRLTRALCWVRKDGDAADNYYSHPVDGLVVMVDMSASPMRVLRVEDHKVVPIPQATCNYTRSHVKESKSGFRQAVKPLHIAQPEGPSFTTTGRNVDIYHYRKVLCMLESFVSSSVVDHVYFQKNNGNQFRNFVMATMLSRL